MVGSRDLKYLMKIDRPSKGENCYLLVVKTNVGQGQFFPPGIIVCGGLVRLVRYLHLPSGQPGGRRSTTSCRIWRT